MQNSNYFVTTAKGRFVLTLFERIETEALDFYLTLQDHLAHHGIPCPQPLADQQGRRWRLLAGKPAALLSCLPGTAEETPAPAHCYALGEMLARLHLAGAEMANPLPNPCGAAWRQAVGEALLPVLLPEERNLLAGELAFQAAQDFSALPRGIIHADLFRDNVLWESCTPRVLPAGGAQLSGVLDFYFAGEDCLLFDLAVVANDWCLNGATLAELLAGYQSQCCAVQTPARIVGRLSMPACAERCRDRSLACHAAGGRTTLLAAPAGGQTPPTRGRSGDDQGSRAFSSAIAAFAPCPRAFAPLASAHERNNRISNGAGAFHG